MIFQGKMDFRNTPVGDASSLFRIVRNPCEKQYRPENCLSRDKPELLEVKSAFQAPAVAFTFYRGV